MEDAVFGTLAFVPGTWSDGGGAYWEKEEHIDLLDAAIPLQIYSGIAGPAEEQQQVYLMFKQNQTALKANLQDALFKFYQVERENYADVYAEICADASLGLNEEEFLPTLKTSDQIWGILTPYSLRVYCGNERHDVAIYWHGSWDVEHEFSTLFKDGKLPGVEVMGGIFYPYPG